MLVMVNAAVPVLVITTVCDALVKFKEIEPNDKLVAENVTGAVGATPVPVNAIVCGEPAALSVIVIAAVFAPLAVGPKCPWMVQFAPTARLVPQVLANTNWDAPVPVTAMLVMVSAAVPVLVMVTVCEPLDCPTVTEPKARLAADKVTGGVSPVPLSEMLCGESLALSVMVMAAVKAPTAVGAKCPWMLQFAPAARLVPQLFAKTNDEALAPVTAMLVIDKADPPVLVRVTDCELPEAPTVTEPNERLVADNETIGPARPFPISWIACEAPATFRLLSVHWPKPLMLPAAVGLKSNAMVQLVPAAS
jgi:hypothetical protein